MLIYFIVILAAITRFVPHMPNFAPITALAIFSAANLGWKKSVGITLAARFTSDIFLGLFAWPLMLAVYGCHLAGVLFGLWIRKTSSAGFPPPSRLWQAGRPRSPHEGRDGESFWYWVKIIVSSLGASILFFLVTNFAFLYSTYPHNITGIIAAYTNGLPFFRGTLLGDLGYSVALFSGYQLAQSAARRFIGLRSWSINGRATI